MQATIHGVAKSLHIAQFCNMNTKGQIFSYENTAVTELSYSFNKYSVSVYGAGRKTDIHLEKKVWGNRWFRSDLKALEGNLGKSSASLHT